MPDLSTLGDLLLCISILGGGILFVFVNVKYAPEKEETRGHGSNEKR